MFELSYMLTILAVLLLAGVCSSKLSTYFNVPVLLVFLGVGMLAGSDGIGDIYFDNAYGANIIGSIAMAFILFAGGMDTKWSNVRSVLGYGSVLSSVGVLITAFLVGVFVWQLMDVPLEWGLLLGAIVSSTDAAAVFSILRSRSVSLRGKLSNILEFESGSNDPMAAFLTVFMVGVLSNPETSYWVIIPEFLYRMLIGILAGFTVAKVMIWLINHIDLEYDGLYYVLGVGAVLFAYGGCESIGGNGFMSVYVCGMVLGNQRYLFNKGLKRFHDGVAWLMQVLLFCTLELLVYPSQLPSIAGVGLLIAVFIMLIARPVAIFLCMLGSSFSWRERLFISWVGLRGGAPIMLATIPMLAGTDRYQDMFNIVFFIVITSVLLQGKTLMPLARLLKLDSPLRSRKRVPLEFEYTGMSNEEMREYDLPEDTVLSGVRIADMQLPSGALILLIIRDNHLVVPHGNTELESNDVLIVLGAPQVMKEMDEYFNSRMAVAGALEG